MSPHNGDVAAQEIRKIEEKNGIEHQNRIPIIALSSDSTAKDIFHFFHCQMNDYFIKGSEPDLLLNVIAAAI
jgi:DNA-binding NarL/FixJ family response regulator